MVEPGSSGLAFNIDVDADVIYQEVIASGEVLPSILT